MALARTVHADLFRVFLLTLVSLFAIPAATLAFTEYALRSQDAEFLQAIEKRIANDSRLTPAEKAEATGFYRSHQLSKACDATAPEDRNFHDKVCSPYSMQWQFHWADRAAIWTIVLGSRSGRAATSPKYGRSNIRFPRSCRSRRRSKPRPSDHWCSGRWPGRSGMPGARQATSPLTAVMAISC